MRKNYFVEKFNKKNTIRLQYMENEHAGTTQDNFLISKYFLKIKTLCFEILELEKKNPILAMLICTNMILLVDCKI